MENLRSSVRVRVRRETNVFSSSPAPPPPAPRKPPCKTALRRSSSQTGLSTFVPFEFSILVPSRFQFRDISVQFPVQFRRAKIRRAGEEALRLVVVAGVRWFCSSRVACFPSAGVQLQKSKLYFSDERFTRNRSTRPTDVPSRSFCKKMTLNIGQLFRRTHPHEFCNKLNHQIDHHLDHDLFYIVDHTPALMACCGGSVQYTQVRPRKTWTRTCRSSSSQPATPAVSHVQIWTTVYLSWKI